MNHENTPMPTSNFQLGQRLKDFALSLRSIETKRKETVLFFLGWLLSFLLINILSFDLDFIFQLVHGYFLFKLVGDIQKKYRPPSEVLIACFFVFALFEILLLRSIYSSTSLFSSTISNTGWFPKSTQIFIHAILVLTFSLILVRNTGDKRGTLFGFLCLAFICLYLIEHESFLAFLFLQIFLFIYLLRKTKWLEELTKAECWIALLVVFLMFRGFRNLNPFEGIHISQFTQAVFWYALPKFWYITFKIYLLAVLIKIPIVLVYNFASLSRKLRISGLFQSTFPQLIQLAMLLIIFYFFIAGWQAEKVRKSVFVQMDKVISGNAPESINWFKVETGDFDSILQIKGYQPIKFGDFDNLPAEGILTIPLLQSRFSLSAVDVDYFLFIKDSETDKERIYIVKLDRNFLSFIARETSILAGTQLLAYPYNPPTWESYIYKIGIWKDERSFRIVPFGVTRQRSGNIVAAPFEQTEESTTDWMDKINEILTRRNQFTFGLVIAPLMDAQMQEAGFFAFDILLVPSTSLFTWSLVSYILLLGLIFLLVDLLVIQRMTKFGSEINRMIVQKFTQLRDGIREISSGNLDYKVKVEGKDEFVELADRFNQMGDRLKESIAEAREKERLQHELTIARKVQLDLLPQTLPEIPGFEIAATIKTANEVGGDFYDVVPLDEDRFLFTIGDVSGKGTSAAFYMAQCISLLRYSPQFTDDPREIALRLNQYFADPKVDRQIFITAIIGILDVKTSTVRMVRAGHPPPIFIPGKEKEKIRELELKGLGLGLERSGKIFEETLEEKKLKLNSGDSLILYTDGVVEAARLEENVDSEDKYKFYSEERLMSFLQASHGKSPANLLEALNKDVESFFSGDSPNDDFTLLVIRKE
ncbi:SpoIIE family protein phosphatase [candidate division KSB1 bacterium]|nr:SpoIIE family protein phosphatase [candidate division KSB1 bacterium]